MTIPSLFCEFSSINSRTSLIVNKTRLTLSNTSGSCPSLKSLTFKTTSKRIKTNLRNLASAKNILWIFFIKVFSFSIDPHPKNCLSIFQKSGLGISGFHAEFKNEFTKKVFDPHKLSKIAFEKIVHPHPC